MWLSVALLLYVYGGYPLLLAAVVRVRGARPVRRADICPPTSLVISAHNEARVMRRKIENSISLDYPADALDIVVVSDASTDGTDEIVEEYTDRGVRLLRQPTRRGKTAGLNLALRTLRGEIVVFSDANAMYAPDALGKLVRNFADPTVGCVTGEARYLAGGRTADVGESTYWSYEMRLKRLESALWSTVGGDGAIYAIRRHLWTPLHDTAINDFLNPLQIVHAGWRAVYEPQAVCLEETTGDLWQECRRRIRIVSRGWRAVFDVPGVLNPRRVGLFALCVVSHKVLRWLSGLFIATAAVGTVSRAAGAMGSPSAWLLAVGISGAAGGLATRRGRRLAALGLYAVAIQAASLVGVLKGMTGRVSGTWSTHREPRPPAARAGVSNHAKVEAGDTGHR